MSVVPFLWCLPAGTRAYSAHADMASSIPSVGDVNGLGGQRADGMSRGQVVVAEHGTADPNASVIPPDDGSDIGSIPSHDPNCDPLDPAGDPNGSSPPDGAEMRIASSREGISDPNVSVVVPAPDPNAHDVAGETVTELVGFLVRGRWLHERLQIVDLDSLVTPDGKRWLPLLRILSAFQLKSEEQGSVIRFAPEGVGNVELDLATKEIQIRGETHPIDLRQAVSEITLKPDVYVLPEDLWKILGMELVWDTEMYEYHVQLDRKLSIWKLPSSGSSLLAVPTKYVGMDLPESQPPADPSRAPLQLLEVSWRPSYHWRRSSSNTSDKLPDSHIVNVGGPRETFWGNWINGQYRVQISHPNPTWSNTEGWRWPNDDPYVAQLDWFEWVHRLPSAEVVAGDSSFGLSDLVYPTFNATGVRVNGLIGWTSDELKTDRSGRGLSQYFGRTYIFEGPAPIDAEVELIVNGRTTDIQNVRSEADSPPGMGVYRFEDVELPSGILNEVTILIRESNGNEIRVEKSIAGTPQLLPRGRAAYLGIVGTKRETFVSDRETFEAGDFYGYITGGRLLYGLTDRLTVGTTVACEQDHYHRLLEDRYSAQRRPYPQSGGQVGTMLSYTPLDNLIVSGNVATSWGQGQDGYDDMAARSRVEYLPTQNLSLDLDLLNLGTDYFDGTDPEVSDRRGGETGLTWKLCRNWTLDGGIGRLRDNLDGQSDETVVVDYRNVGLTTTVLPRTSLSAKLHNLDVNTEENPRWLTELGLRIMPTRDVSIFGRTYLGDELSVEEDDRFLALLRLRHAPRSLRPSQYWTIRKTLNLNSSVGLIYNDAEYEETLSLAYDLNAKVKGRLLRLHTEFLKELEDDPEGEGYGFRGRAEYLFDNVGYNYLGATAEYRHGDYAVTLYLNVRNLYTRHDRRLTNVNESRIRTGYGAVHGKVFLDYNGDHLLDADEPGVADVKVHLGPYLTTVTDDRGYYVLSVPPNASEARVYLDPDTVPATYSVTHGTQVARVYRDSLTVVNLGLSPLISVVGHIMAVDANASEPNTPDPNTTPDPNAPEFSATVIDAVDANDLTPQTHPLAGVHVTLSDAQSDRLAADSYTAGDGSYYLGNVKPGRYVLRVDSRTLPATCLLAEMERVVVVEPTREEFMEIILPDFTASLREEPKPDDEASPGDSQEK